MSRTNFSTATKLMVIPLAILLLLLSVLMGLWIGITAGLICFILFTICCYLVILAMEDMNMALKESEVIDFSYLDSDYLYTALQLPGCPDPARIFNYDGMLSRLEDEMFQEYLINNINNGYLSILPILYGDIATPVDGENLVYSDLTQAPSLLIAGISGSGKSTLLHSILSVLLTYNTSNNLELYLCDTKRVELNRYAKFPHVKKIIYTHEDVDAFLTEIHQEINERYQYLESVGITSIQEYNKLKLGDKMRMPFLVVVIEELADIMLGSSKEVQHKLIKILQKGRAAGVHVIALTQRPSAQIINSNIKANMPTRVALRVSSATDSRIIIEQTGAEGLTNNKGEMYILDGGKLKYAQGILVTPAEIKKLEQAWLA